MRRIKGVCSGDWKAYDSDLVCCIGSFCIGRVGQASLWVSCTTDVADNSTFHFREKECLLDYLLTHQLVKDSSSPRFLRRASAYVVYENNELLVYVRDAGPVLHSEIWHSVTRLVSNQTPGASALTLWKTSVKTDA